MNIRITIKPLNTNKAQVKVERCKSIGGNFHTLSEFIVSRKGGTTTYEPIPSKETFNRYPFDDHIKNLIHAYFDGQNGEENHSWIFGDG